MHIGLPLIMRDLPSKSMVPTAGIVLFSAVVAFLAMWVWQLQLAAAVAPELRIDALPLWIVLFLVTLTVVSFFRWAQRGFAPRATQFIRRQPASYNSEVQKIAEKYARSFAWRRGLELK